MMDDLGIKKWIHYNPNVGVEGLHMIGLPGTGKSNMATGLMMQCLKKGETMIMPGDRFCEWRHFPYHPIFKKNNWDITILVPEATEITYVNFEKNGWFQSLEYDDLEVMNYLQGSNRLLVIYDQHLRLQARAALWVEVLTQLLNRTEHLEQAIGLLFHEAGIYFSEYSSGDQWRAIKNFSELFVECRKGLVRNLIVSQLDTEIESTVRKKCMFACIRKTKLARSIGWPKPLIKAAPFTPINGYHWTEGGLYNRSNTVKKFFEKKIIYKMIPHISLNKARETNPLPQKTCQFCNYEWTPRSIDSKHCPKCRRVII